MSWKDLVVMTYQFVGGLLMFLGGVANDCYRNEVLCDIPNWRPLKIQAGVVGLVVLLIIYYSSKPKKKKKFHRKLRGRRCHLYLRKKIHH